VGSVAGVEISTKKRMIELSESKHMNRGQEQGDREKNEGLVD